MRCTILSLKEISASQWHEVMRLRSDVFVVEQQCVYPDPEVEDHTAHHILGMEDDELIAYARIVRTDAWNIGRVIVREDQRRKGRADALMKTALDFCLQQDRDLTIRLSAQVYLSDFYHSLSFQPEGSMYLEDGIPHLEFKYVQG